MAAKPTVLQKFAQRFMVGACVVLAMGVSVSAARRAGEGDSLRHLIEPPTANDLILASPVKGPAASERDPAQTTGGRRVEVTPPSAAPAGALNTPRVIWMEVTAYCPCRKCCGSDAHGVTASGKTVRHDGGRFVAADTRLLPFGTRLSIPGYHAGRTVEVIDRGGAIKGNRLDVFYPTHAQALQWGRQQVPVTILE